PPPPGRRPTPLPSRPGAGTGEASPASGGTPGPTGRRPHTTLHGTPPPPVPLLEQIRAKKSTGLKPPPAIPRSAVTPPKEGSGPKPAKPAAPPPPPRTKE